MRIFAKKAFCFQNPNVKNITELSEKELREALVYTRPMDFMDVPDWVAEDDMFKWAQKDGDIEVLDRKVLVGGAPVKASEEVVDYHDMKASQLYKLCIEKGIECEEKKSKDYYIELLEASEAEGAEAGDATEE